MDAKKLIERMTIEEKAEQLTQVNSSLLNEKSTADITGPLLRLGLTANQISGIGSALNFSRVSDVKEIQENHLKTDRHAIPLLFMQDVIHGCCTIYPIPLAMGAAFSPELIKECSAMAARECVENGINVVFSPAVDMVRDARWGRVAESTGEDVYLNSLYAKAQVEGYHTQNVAVCVKHFAAYGAAEAGRDYNTVDMSEITLREYYLPAYKAALDAGADMVMTSFNLLNGVPAAANKKLVKGILRDEWGFDGVVISDYASFDEMMVHGIAENGFECAYKAMEATGDIEMVSLNYIRYLKELVGSGKINVEQVNKAVERVLALKQKLGLFDDPYINTKPKKKTLCKEHRAIAEKAAVKSAVLLKNDGVLPLSDSAKKIAVIGPFADSGDIIGCWHCYGNIKDAVTVATGIRSLFPSATVQVEEGVGFEIGAQIDGEKLRSAINLAKESEAVILAIGEPSSDSGESASKLNLDLSDGQYELVKSVVAANKNTAVLLFSGRPLTVKRFIDIAPAVLLMWHPGTEGGTAAAKLLFGKCCPEGKLPMSFPMSVGQCPIYYNRYNTGRPRANNDIRSPYTSSYIDGSNLPLFPFGYGLSYTQFRYSDIKLSNDKLNYGDEIIVSVEVKNVGKRSGVETVQLYIQDVAACVARPLRELKGFKKVWLASGESQTVEFAVDSAMLEFYNEDNIKTAEKGRFRVFVGTDSDTLNYAEFELL